MKNPANKIKRIRTMVTSFHFRPGPGTPVVAVAVFIVVICLALSGSVSGTVHCCPGSSG
jgi:hypothetical protein